jgi:hypothetical protein
MAMWENYKRLGLPGPTPLVVLWGSGSGDLAGALRRPDVLAGGDIAGYLRRQELVDPRLGAEQIESVLRAVHEHVQKRDAAEADRNPIPESIQALAFRFASGVVAGLVSFVGAGYLLKAGLPVWAWFTALGAMIGIEQLLRRRPSLRNVVTGSQAALVMTALLVAAVAGAQIVR